MPLITPTINGYAFWRLIGAVQDFRQTVQDITRPNKDGHAFRLLGQQAKPYTLDSRVDFETAASAEAAFATFRALVGTVATVKDEVGIEHPSQVVLDIERVGVKYAASICGGLVVTDGAPGYVLHCRWTLQAGGDPTAEPPPDPGP